MVLKGLPEDFKAFKTVITQKDKQSSYSEFKVSLRAFEENEKITSKTNDNVMKTGFHNTIKSYACKLPGHKADQCTRSKKWCRSCRSKTQDTKECRKKNVDQDNDSHSSSAKIVTDANGEQSFAFKVSINVPASNDQDVD